MPSSLMGEPRGQGDHIPETAQWPAGMAEGCQWAWYRWYSTRTSSNKDRDTDWNGTETPSGTAQGH